MNQPFDLIRNRLESARRELLDLGLRNNPLLNYRPLSSRGLQIVDGLSSQVFQVLVKEGRSITFLSASSDEQMPLLTEEKDTSSQPTEMALSGLKLQTSLAPEQLQKRLLSTYYAARTFIEERGVNVLFFALGMLKWYESDDSQDEFKAPLILVPVELERSNARDRFRLHYTEEEIEDNLSLLEKLRTEFGIPLPQLPDTEDLDTTAYLDAVRQAVQGQPRWSVDSNSVVLGFFWFGKYLMFKDMEEGIWPADSKPSQHPVIQALLGDGFRESPSPFSEEDQIDHHLASRNTFHVKDADSSQTVAILDVMEGRNLVVQGPPGTGKSQTIVNLIAEAVGHGKTVLFVAEKMAALEVVWRRLDKAGLGRVCLELHSQKTHKKTVLEELRATLETAEPELDRPTLEPTLLETVRQRLNDYCEAVNSPIGNSNITPYKAYGELIRLGKRLGVIMKPDLQLEGGSSWTDVEFQNKQSLIEQMQSRLIAIGVPQQHPFWGSQRKVFLPTERDRLAAKIENARNATRTVAEHACQTAAELGLEKCNTRTQAEMRCLAVRMLIESPPLEGVNINSNGWTTSHHEVSALVGFGRNLTEIHSSYDSILSHHAWDLEVAPVKRHLEEKKARWWRFLSGSYRHALKTVAKICNGRPPKTLDEKIQLLDAVLQARKQTENIRLHEKLGVSLFGSQWKGQDSDWNTLSRITEWVFRLHQEISNGRLPKDLLACASANRKISEALLQELQNDLQAHSTAIEEVVSFLEMEETRRFRSKLEDQTFESQLSLLTTWLNEINRLKEIASYNTVADSCRLEHLAPWITLAETWQEAGNALADLFLWKRLDELLTKAFGERPALAGFDGDSQSQFAQRFRDLGTLFLKYNRARLAKAHAQRLPRHDAGGQLGILKREFEKRSRHLPIRQLMQKAGNAIQAIKPVFMLSPLSIAAFLPAGSVSFDLVIFDEASQVKPVDAFGAILRGKQVVVVGDSQQLPPTNFFDVIAHGEEWNEDNVVADVESILGLFNAQGAPNRMLRWHYRSRHESLIAVSNFHFYRNRLIVFPSSNTALEKLGLVFNHLPHTAYDRGRTRTNRQEANIVAKAVMNHARHYRELSLGVAAFSVAQMEAIQEELELLRREDPTCEDYFSLHSPEPFFVKNLENVQGDERDVIFISVGYGRTAEGLMTMGFGPLNRMGGERRLNVLITRARLRCEVFTNLTADDIDLSQANAPGMRALKSFLSFAQNGTLDVPVPTGHEADSPFEEMVYFALSDLGYRIQKQVGSAGFFIDLAVVDEQKPGRYLLGIECDGATYHRARSTRDRDRLRQQILEDLGWRVHRIWSTDWFRNPERELKRVVAAIEAARSHEPIRVESPGFNSINSSPSDKDSRNAEVRSSGIEDSHVPEYQLANLTILTYGSPIHLVPVPIITSWVESVVLKESPAHVEEIFRRIADAAGINRIGNRIREVFESAVKHCHSRGSVCQKGDFFWIKGMESPVLRDRSQLPATSRKLELISPEEIGIAIETAVSRAYGMPRNETPSAACRLLGFSRTTEDMRDRIESVLSNLLSIGRLVEQGTHVIVVKNH